MCAHTQDPDTNIFPPLPLVLLFMTTWGRDMLSVCSTWLVDATFKTAPFPFFQVSKKNKNCLLKITFINHSSTSSMQEWIRARFCLLHGRSCQAKESLYM